MFSFRNGSKYYLFFVILMLVSACATPERVNNPRLFEQSADRLTEFLVNQGFRFNYRLTDKMSIFPSSVHTISSLQAWHRFLKYGDLPPPKKPTTPKASQRLTYKYQIAVSKYKSFINELSWIVFSQDRLHKLKLIDYRNAITINRALTSVNQQILRLLEIMNSNPAFFNSVDFATARGILSRLSITQSEALARIKELVIDICSSAGACGNAELSRAAMDFSRQLQRNMFLSDYLDQRYVDFISQKIAYLKASRDFELYFFSLNTNAETKRVLRLEQALAYYEEIRSNHQKFRVQYQALLRKGGYKTFNGFHNGLDKIFMLIGELKLVVDGFQTGTVDLAITFRLLSQIEEESNVVKRSFDRFSSIIVSGYFRDIEDYAWPD